jgi:hypothetical protein
MFAVVPARLRTHDGLYAGGAADEHHGRITPCVTLTTPCILLSLLFISAAWSCWQSMCAGTAAIEHHDYKTSNPPHHALLLYFFAVTCSCLELLVCVLALLLASTLITQNIKSTRPHHAFLPEFFAAAAAWSCWCVCWRCCRQTF